MMTAWKRVGPLPTHRLAVRHSVDYSSSDHFALDDSLRDSSSSSSSSSSSETSSDPSSNDLSDSSSDRSLPAPSSGMRPSHHLCLLVQSISRSSTSISDRPSHDSSAASLSRKMSRSPTASVPLSSPIPGAFSSMLSDLLPSPKRIRSPESATDLEVSLVEGFEPSRYRGTDLEMDDDVERDHIQPRSANSPFLLSTDDSSDSDTPDTPPSPTHGTLFTEMTLPTQSTPVASGALRRRVMILAPEQPIPHGRSYRYHPNGWYT
nr:hypothetical protein [Tanacetum cinerariifolium]